MTIVIKNISEEQVKDLEWLFDSKVTRLPPHGRLIDADALVDELIKRSRTNPMPLLGQMVDFAPTVIESEEA